MTEHTEQVRLGGAHVLNWNKEIREGNECVAQPPLNQQPSLSAYTCRRPRQHQSFDRSEVSIFLLESSF